MDDLIKALQILRKYGNPSHPTDCSHDLLHVDISPDIVSEDDKAELDKLGFHVDDELEGFSSFRYGSC